MAMIASAALRTCYMCKVAKPESDFALRSQRTGRRQAHCRACQRAYRRKHYVANRVEYVARELSRMHGNREKNRSLLLAYLADHPCVDCGEKDPIVLDLDHRDPLTKTADVSTLAARRSWERVLAEIEKCDVRCASCHHRRTAKQFDWSKNRPTQLRLHAVVLEVPLPMPESTSADDERICTGCETSKPIWEFSFRSRTTGERLRRCRTCVAMYARKHYERNRARYKRRARRWRKSTRRACRAQVLDYLLSHPCLDCGETDPLALEFDHRDPSVKTRSLAELLRRGCWPAIQAEIPKCDVRCANCHRRRTARQFAWNKTGRSDRIALSRE